MKDEQYFEGATEGWMIATPRRTKPLLYDWRFPIFWTRSVAKLQLKPWMAKSGCRIVRVVVRIKPKRKSTASPRAGQEQP